MHEEEEDIEADDHTEEDVEGTLLKISCAFWASLQLVTPLPLLLNFATK